MAKAPASTKTLYGAKHTFGAFKIVEITNVISSVITLISPPQRVYRSSTQFHPTIKINTKYNLPATKP
jgi:hypothetical protein